MSPVLSHADTVRVTVSLGSLLSPVAGFGEVLFIDTFANSSLAGFAETSIGSKSTKFVRIGAYSEATDANTAVAGSVGTALLQDLAGAFGHSKSPTFVNVLSVDRADGGNGTDTYAEALSALVNAGYNNFYAVIPVSHTVTDIIDILEGLIAVQSASRPRIVIAQTSNAATYGDSAAWIAARVNGASAAPSATALERLAICYHADAQPCAAAFATWGLSFSPDTTSAPWCFTVPAIADVALPSGVSETTFKTNLRGTPGTDLGNKINVALPFGSSTTFNDPGVMQSGRAIYVVISADWFQARLTSRLADLQLTYADAGAKLPLNPTGQALVRGLIESLYLEGVAHGHFLSREDAKALGATVTIRGETITAEDRALRRMRFTVNIPVLHGARVLNIAVTITE